VAAKTILAVAAVVLVFVVGGVVFAAGSGGLSSPLAQDNGVSNCLANSQKGMVAKRTVILMEDMGSELNTASAIGTTASLAAAAARLRDRFGPAFSELGTKWTDLDDCGDSAMAGYYDRIAQELFALGLELTNFKQSDRSSLTRASNHMTEISNITDEVVAHLSDPKETP
jgi:hypothetical protein